MLANICPVEIWLEIFSYLCTRDLINLSHCCKHLYDIAEDVRSQRQDINRLLANFVKDVNGFRLTMKRTGAIIVGQFATSFFTGEAPTNTYCNSLDLALPNTGPCECWFSLLKGDIVASGNGCSSKFKDAKVSHPSPLKKAYYQRDHPVKIQQYVRTQNPDDGSQLLLQILPAPCRITDTRPTDGSLAFARHNKHCTPETCWYDDAWGPNDCNFIYSRLPVPPPGIELRAHDMERRTIHMGRRGHRGMFRLGTDKAVDRSPPSAKGLRRT